MSKKLLVSVILLLTALTVIGCSGNAENARKATSVIAVSDNLDYDENAWRTYLAEVKPVCLVYQFGCNEPDCNYSSCKKHQCACKAEEMHRILAECAEKPD